MKRFLSIVFLVLVGVAFCEPVKSMLGSDGCEISMEETENPYIQDGLIAQFDGIWNAGLGIHDPDATVWVDLVSGDGMTINTRNTYWTNYSLVGIERVWQSANISLAMGNSSAIPDFARTVEIVVYTDNIENQCLYAKGGWDTPLYQHIYFSGSGLQFARTTSGHSNGISRTNLPTLFYAARTCTSEGISTSIYLNGEEYYGLNRGRSFSSTPFNFGCGHPQRADISAPFIGEVFAMRFYARELTSEEIEWNYSIDKERFGL